MKQKIKTRIAPSPTGYLHVGTARAALFNYLFARQNEGIFILRIEDTDVERSDKRFEKNILEGLEWLGLRHDEFYRQSERTDIYQKYIKQLLETKAAFFCTHTKHELDEEKKRQMQNKEPLRHDCGHKTENKTRGIVRLRGSDEKIRFNDLIRGEIESDASLLGDVAIAKDEKTPLYNLAVVIDDHEMEITHVIRGEDHIPNTPKQILIQKALGLKTPFYAHMPLILGPDRSKLSKRHGAVSIVEYKKQGYLPEAFINFAALLGWSPKDDKEIFTMEELIKAFSLDKMQKGGAIFNIEKLNWFNKEYIKKTDGRELAGRLSDYLPKSWKEKIKKNPEYWIKIAELEKDRLTKLSEIKEGIDFFFKKPKFKKELLAWKNEKEDKTKLHLDRVEKLLSGLESARFGKDDVKKAVWDYAEEQGRGNVLWPFRVALTGLEKSPDPFTVAEILGMEETIKRVGAAKNMI